jgi:hypothetical protein
MIDHISVSSSSFFTRSARVMSLRLRGLSGDVDDDGSESVLVLVSDACSAYISNAWAFILVVNSLLRPFVFDDA